MKASGGLGIILEKEGVMSDIKDFRAVKEHEDKAEDVRFGQMRFFEVPL